MDNLFETAALAFLGVSIIDMFMAAFFWAAGVVVDEETRREVIANGNQFAFGSSAWLF